MTGRLLNLPVAVPWVQIAVSPDMMDTQFCNKRFPATWRSSIAISAYEPRLEELPEGLCDQRLTYLKVTCSITGYQPSRKDGEEAELRFPDVPIEELDGIFAEYFACYGVLLNVAVFPFPDTQTLLLNKDTIEFIGLEVDDPGSLPNPLIVREVAFEASDQESNRLVELFSSEGDAILGLDLQREMVITLPAPADRVVAQVVRTTGGPITLAAFRGEEMVGEEMVGEALTGDELDIHELTVDATAIDRLIFSAPEDAAMLTALSYFEAVSVPVPVSAFPHVVDVQPKVRDLYQAATETGEILTASVSAVKTDKSLASTEETETSFNLGAQMPIPSGPPTSTMRADFSRKRTEKEEDTWAVATDASRERRETHGTTTQLSQMYNLLTSYHVGTNRAASLMLPRPNVLQPTDHRTFVQGLRYIEGIQEWILIVSRPSTIEGLCVEASLDTGHFPEDVTVDEPPEEFDERHEDFIVAARSQEDESNPIEEFLSAQYTIESGWVIDRREARRGALGDPDADGWDPGHPGIKDLDSGVVDGGAVNLAEDGTLVIGDQAGVVLYNYQPISDSSVQVSGRVVWRVDPDEHDFHVRNWRRRYRVFTRSQEPRPSTGVATVTTPFLITSRGLCVRFRSGDTCPVVAAERPDFNEPLGEWVVSEDTLSLAAATHRRSITSQTRGPATKDLLRKIQSKMTTSGRLRTRYPNGEIGFLDTNLFADRVRNTIPDDVVQRPAREVEGLPEPVASAVGRATVAEALQLPLPELARRAGVSVAEAARARRRLLGGRDGQG